MSCRVDREDFIRTPKGVSDGFASTFKAKADAMNLWPNVVGIMNDHEVLAAICVRWSKRYPIVANLQLLYTFAAHRRQGLARRLVLEQYARLTKDVILGLGGPEYFRVSSEPDAADFYRSLGLKFWGKQKSGSLLCIHRIKSALPKDGSYKSDSFIESQLSSGRRGSLVERFDAPR